jgi:hypothetical protein
MGSGGEWLSLGVYEFAAGTDGSVTVSDDANGFVVADAVRFTEMGLDTATTGASFPSQLSSSSPARSSGEHPSRR